MGNNTKFNFGNTSVNKPLPNEKEHKPKPKKIKLIEKEIHSYFEAYNCNDRIKDKSFICGNENCNCNFKKELLDDAILEINKTMIQEYFSENNINDKWGNNLLKLEWRTRTLRSSFGKNVYQFISQCKFVYDLDLIIKPKKREKINSATQAKNCKDRIPATDNFCQGCNIIKDNIQIAYHCIYSKYTDIQLKREALREYFIKKLKSNKIPKWDRITLTFNWALLTQKQEKMVQDFIFKYKNLMPKSNTKNIP